MSNEEAFKKAEEIQESVTKKIRALLDEERLKLPDGFGFVEMTSESGHLVGIHIDLGITSKT